MCKNTAGRSELSKPGFKYQPISRHPTKGAIIGAMKAKIVQDPKILGGKPIIAGTRMSVEGVLELLASGMEIKEILREYPFLNKSQIQTAVGWANKLVKKEESYFFNRAKSTPHEISGRR